MHPFRKIFRLPGSASCWPGIKVNSGIISKVPRWMSSFTGKRLEFDVVTGLNHMTRPMADYALVVQCGGCMITRKQLVNRLKPAIDAGVPVTNYGMAIAWMQGVYARAIGPFVKGGGGEELL